MKHKKLANYISLAGYVSFVTAFSFAHVTNATASDLMTLRGSQVKILGQAHDQALNAELMPTVQNYQNDMFAGQLNYDAAYPDIKREMSWFSKSKTSSTIKHKTLQNSSNALITNGATSIGSFIDDSLQNSDLLRGSMHDAMAAGEAKNAAIFALFPTIGFEARKTRSFELTSLGASPVDSTTLTNSFSGNWNVFSSGAGIASIRAAKFTALSADMQYLSNERRLVVQAVGVYLQLLSGQKLEASLSGAKARMKKILHTTRVKYKTGFASRTDVAQVENEIADIELQLSQATTNLNQSHVKWLSLTGRRASRQLSMPSIGQLLPPSKQATIQKALRSNPAILGAQYSAKAARQQIKVASAQFLPKVSVYGNIDIGSAGRYSTTTENQWEVGAKFSVPLMNLSSSSQYRQARETAHASKYRAREQKRKVEQEVETNWVSLNSFKRSSVILRKKIDAQYKILNGIGKEVSAGLRPLGDQLREETRYAQSQIDLIQNDLSKVAAVFQIAIHFDDFTLDSIR